MRSTNVQSHTSLNRVCKKILLTMAVTVFLAPIVDAEEDGSGAYVGLGFGSTAYVDNGFVKEGLSEPEEVAKTDRGFKLYGGYQFNKIIGVETSYTDYGTFKAGDYEQTSRAVSLAANLGYSFLDGQLRPYGLLGFEYLINEFPHEKEPSLEENSVGSHLGIGLDYTPKGLGGLGFRMAYEGTSYSYEVDSNTSVNDEQYGQGFGIVYFGVQYRF